MFAHSRFTITVFPLQLSNVNTNEELDALHESSANSAMQKSSLSKKIIKDNPDIRKSLRLCKERFRKMLEMKMVGFPPQSAVIKCIYTDNAYI